MSERTTLVLQARSASSAHEAVLAEVGDLEGRHLLAHLPGLRGEKDERPGKLDGGPEGDEEEVGVVSGRCAEDGGEDARGTGFGSPGRCVLVEVWKAQQSSQFSFILKQVERG